MGSVAGQLTTQAGSRTQVWHTLFGLTKLMPALPSVLRVASLPGFHLRLTFSCTDAHLQAGRNHQRQSHPPSHSGSASVASERRVHLGHSMASSLLLSAAIGQKLRLYYLRPDCGNRVGSWPPSEKPLAPQTGKSGKEGLLGCSSDLGLSVSEYFLPPGSMRP